MKEKVFTILKRIIAFVCVLLIFVGIWKGLRYILADDVSPVVDKSNNWTSYVRVMLHEYYNQENIDILFCGASLIFNDIDVNVMDKKLNVNSFDLGTVSQELDITYVLIKDGIKRNDVKTIYLELSPIMAYRMNIKNRKAGTLNSVYYVLDFMEPSINKLQLMFGAVNSNNYINEIFVARRHWERILKPKTIIQIIRSKNNKAYKDYEYGYLHDESNKYMGKGYIPSSKVIYNDAYVDHYRENYGSLNVDSITNEWYEYLYKIIDYCKSNNVKICLFCAPLSNPLLESMGTRYDDYHSLVSGIADEAEIEFYDFSLVNRQYWEYSSENYLDTAHLNQYGAEKFSNLFADVINGDISTDGLFYDTIEEKLENK